MDIKHMVKSSLINRLFKSKKEVVLYKNCSDLPIYNFDMVFKSRDYRYLIIGFNGYTNEIAPKEAEKRWKEIYNEWLKYSDNNSVLYYYNLISEVSYLETRYICVGVILEQLALREHSDDNMEFFIKTLRDFKYIYNANNKKQDELKRLTQQHKGSENKLNLKRSELQELMKQNSDEEVSSLEAQAVQLEQITGKNNIDIFTTSVIKWVEICKIATLINDQRRKQNGK